MGTVFSGIQPSGIIHVGNYLGAVRNWARLQREHTCYFCIVNYHAVTVSYDPQAMPRLVLDAVASNVAAGLDPERAVIFVQSHVPEHTELCWLLTCITPLGSLQRMHQFKEKARRQADGVAAGLMCYPILQAADILIYKAGLVPVGEDQVQHIELTRDIARRFNALFGQTFPEPEALLSEAARIMALNDPEKKMSKSVPGSYVSLSDEPEEIRRKVRRAVTDTGPGRAGERPEEMGPGVRNLFTLLRSFAPAATVRRLEGDYRAGTLRYAELKETLADAMIEALTPIRERKRELLARPAELREMLATGAERARAVARQTLAEVKERMGLADG